LIVGRIYIGGIEHMKKLIFATGNEGKMKEVRMIMADLGYEILSMKEAGIVADIDENGSTFEENALIKARAISKMAGCLVLADDSGLEVDYMDKAPGIYSARFLGEDTSYAIKNKYIMDKLEGVPDEKRTARFVCAIAAVFPDGAEYTRRGTIEGIIGYEERGENGFGYDPIFYLPDRKMTTAELSPEDKNAISHRGNALRQIKEVIKQYAK
jgi:XTP/dITP diphosphohydrolase